jgi:hypothetical protein
MNAASTSKEGSQFTAGVQSTRFEFQQTRVQVCRLLV